MYKPATYDKRPAGARKRHNLAQGSTELGKVPKRQLMPGALELLGLGRGISEDLDTNYNNEEEKLFRINSEVKHLIQELEQKDASKAQ